MKANIIYFCDLSFNNKLQNQINQHSLQHIIGRKLLGKAFEFAEIPFDEKLIQKTTSGKPYINSTSFLDFNISHSSNLVACIFSTTCNVGIDVEYRKTIDVNNYDTQFTKKEWELISEHNDPIDQFYNLWTKKEALLKANGYSIYDVKLSEIAVANNYVFFNNKVWYFNAITTFENYSIHFAANKPANFLIREFSVNNLV